MSKEDLADLSLVKKEERLLNWIYDWFSLLTTYFQNARDLLAEGFCQKLERTERSGKTEPLAPVNFFPFLLFVVIMHGHFLSHNFFWLWLWRRECPVKRWKEFGMRRTICGTLCSLKGISLWPYLTAELGRIHILRQIHDNKKDAWKERVKRFMCRSRFVASRSCKVLFPRIIPRPVNRIESKFYGYHGYLSTPHGTK